MRLGKAPGFTQIGLRRLNGIGTGLDIPEVFIYDGNMRNKNRQLLNLIKKHKLTHFDVAALCHCCRTTVHYWTRDPDDPTFQVIKPAYLRLLRLELGEVNRQREIPRKK